MSRQFSGYDVTDFLNESIGGYLNQIEDLAIEMAKTEDEELRLSLLNDVQYIICQCNAVLN